MNFIFNKYGAVSVIAQFYIYYGKNGTRIPHIQKKSTLSPSLITKSVKSNFGGNSSTVVNACYIKPSQF